MRPVSEEEVRRWCDIARDMTARFRDVDSVFVSGSLLEGFGNETSDLDVYVLTPAETTVSPSDAYRFAMGEFAIDIDYADDVRVDTEIWRTEVFEEIAEEIRSCPVDDPGAAVALPLPHLEVAHRLRIGRAARGPERFTRLRATFDFRRLSLLLANRFYLEYDGWAEDAAGAVRADDAGTAMLMSRWALGAAVDAYSAAVHGATSPKAKWRFAKLQAAGEDELARRYLEADLDPSTLPRDLLQRAKQRLRVADDIVHEVQTAMREARLAAVAPSGPGPSRGDG